MTHLLLAHTNIILCLLESLPARTRPRRRPSSLPRDTATAAPPPTCTGTGAAPPPPGPPPPRPSRTGTPRRRRPSPPPRPGRIWPGERGRVRASPAGVASMPARAKQGQQQQPPCRRHVLEDNGAGVGLRGHLRPLRPPRLVRMLLQSRKAEQNRREAVRLVHGILRHHEERREAGGCLGVLLSKLTDLQLKSNRMLNLGNVLTFRWYFTGPQAFGGILRKS